MPAPCYRADPPGDRRLIALDGLTLLFHRPSGATHILAAPAPEILAALYDGPADAGVILARLSERHGLADVAEAEAIIAARLAELEAAGLVARS